jgi:hypothetical protein
MHLVFQLISARSDTVEFLPKLAAKLQFLSEPQEGQQLLQDGQDLKHQALTRDSQ